MGQLELFSKDGSNLPKSQTALDLEAGGEDRSNAIRAMNNDSALLEEPGVWKVLEVALGDEQTPLVGEERTLVELWLRSRTELE